MQWQIFQATINSTLHKEVHINTFERANELWKGRGNTQY